MLRILRRPRQNSFPEAHRIRRLVFTGSRGVLKQKSHPKVACVEGLRFLSGLVDVVASELNFLHLMVAEQRRLGVPAESILAAMTVMALV